MPGRHGVPAVDVQTEVTCVDPGVGTPVGKSVSQTFACLSFCVLLGHEVACLVKDEEGHAEMTMTSEPTLVLMSALTSVNRLPWVYSLSGKDSA